MAPLKRRLIGSTLFALFSVYVTLGGSRTDGWDRGDAIAMVLGFVLASIVGFHAWPAVEISWARKQPSNACHPLTPSWPRAIGAASIGLVLFLINALVERQLSSYGEVNLTEFIHDLVVFSVIGYFVWPAVGARLLRLRAR